MKTYIWRKTKSLRNTKRKEKAKKKDLKKVQIDEKNNKETEKTNIEEREDKHPNIFVKAAKEFKNLFNSFNIFRRS